MIMNFPTIDTPIAQGKIRQNAFGLLVGDFYFGNVEAAEIKPLLNRALFLTAYQTLCGPDLQLSLRLRCSFSASVAKGRK